MTKPEYVECAWEFARKVAEIDKQLLSSSAVEHIGAMMFAVQDRAARRCAGIAEEKADECAENSNMVGDAVAQEIMLSIRREFGLEAARKGGAARG